MLANMNRLIHFFKYLKTKNIINMAIIKTMYENKCAIIRLSGELDDSTLIEICDQIDLAISYYHLRKIDIHIMSMSSSIESIDYYLAKLNNWSTRAVIGTLATSVISGFGIDIISSGTTGYRRAFRSTVFKNTAIKCSSIGFKQKNASSTNNLDAYFLNDSEINESRHNDAFLRIDNKASSFDFDRFNGKRIISSTEAVSLKLIDYYQDDFQLPGNFLNQEKI